MSGIRLPLLALCVSGSLIPLVTRADPVTFSGLVSYAGPYSGDSLYVAVLDTAGLDTPVYALKAFAVSDPPFSRTYSFTMDNAFAPPVVWIAALLDVDGGGPDNAGDADIVGWYHGEASPVALSTSASRSNLEFFLPTGEIHGFVHFAADQTSAQVWISPDPGCRDARLTRPGAQLTSSGVYALIGVYPGTYCLYAYGVGGPDTPDRICYGDRTCENPTPVVLLEGEVKSVADLFFITDLPVERTTWGRLKVRFP